MQPKALVIGGGFYGCMVALQLDALGVQVILVERESDLLTRASYSNQARIHNGYHYPRSLLTALRSHENFVPFAEEFRDCVVDDFENYYAIARKFSRITAKQFVTFCERVGAPLEAASEEICALFEPDLIEAVYKVREHVFNADVLRTIIHERLRKSAVDCRLATKVVALRAANAAIEVQLEHDRTSTTIATARVFCCAYSALNIIHRLAAVAPLPLKHEWVELVLLSLPKELSQLGVTILDGAFFSLMPFPARGGHSLSHVRYTPHAEWRDDQEAPLDTKRERESYATSMIRDAARYLPHVAKAKYLESLWETKTVLLASERNDSRPIVFQESKALPGFFSVLGGKIDNIADIRNCLRTLYRD